ncbi:type II CRISPR RNA-guided endonuclease Cas9 [Litoribacter ruber]|uniref:type II CRISPR RNA-guided endonuclease Cas9 n=1 Tax=Litoribacter ruber TaxID=702568 RepID=UPI001BDAEE83|nr:type II CRISPR RNA-guided endonuclease Cas9 [Litoribacter ruber]MBT0810086.1 type II CRISPR RNA-guided endonuclease Cas9 [Litoribacter ruber]
MKKILGLDLGTTSIGWAFVHEKEKEEEENRIVDVGVRIVPLTSDEENDFAKGKTISINADRTLKRSARKNLQRFKQRRDALLEIFAGLGYIDSDFSCAESGSKSTYSTLTLRALAVTEKISREDFVKVLMALNKKRGYKSSRKVKSEDDEGVAIDSMGIAKELYQSNLTPGQWVFEALKKGRKTIPDFYRSDLEEEFRCIYEFQKEFFPELLPTDFLDNVLGKTKDQTRFYFNKLHNIPLAENKGKRPERTLQHYKWRNDALEEKLAPSELAFLFTEINGQISASSGYLGAISDRSKELYFNQETVGQYLLKQVEKNRHTRLKGQVFYRQDYLDEFERIWEKQAAYFPELTEKLKKEVRDITIFYQRRLKSQKHLISTCEFELLQKVAPKSSPIFQDFRIWQNLNHVTLTNTETFEKLSLSQEHKEQLQAELTFKKKMAAADVLKEIGYDKNWELNFEELQGNRTNHEIFTAFAKIIELEDGNEIKLNKLRADEILDVFSEAFLRFGINPEYLQVNNGLVGDGFEKQPYLQLWHLLYASEDEKKLRKTMVKKFNFKENHAKIISGVSFQQEHCSLSSKAIKKILPYLILGLDYSEACEKAGYNHSSFLTKEENDNRPLKDELELVKKNALRNPVVEKILNQLVNVVNAIVKDPALGRPDEIRVELARELKANSEQRKKMTNDIGRATKYHQEIRELLKKEFGISRVTRNDIIRYKLWKECGGISIYTGRPIEATKLFSKEYDIEHIIPKARLFDDSFSNKTICERQLNADKSNITAFTFLQETLSAGDFEQYLARVKGLYGKIGRTKIQKLLMATDKIPTDFIERQIRETQYISRKAKEILLSISRNVTVTSGSVTDKLRDDWGLVEVMKELNWDKYNALGLTKIEKGKNGERLKKIKDWSKRNDHRHHAMDALAVAYTKPAYIQYLNNLSAKGIEGEKGIEIRAIERKYLFKENRKLKFISPIPNFREEARFHLGNILVSFKSKNKVVTINKNKIKKAGGFLIQTALTPRGQLHKETVYGKQHQYKTKIEKVGGNFDSESIAKVANKKYRDALSLRLQQFGNDPKKAFTGKNSLTKLPIYLSLEKNITVPEKVKLVWLEPYYTIRKNITPDLKVDKVIDPKIKSILKNRLTSYNEDPKLAFANIDENPIWLNKEKGIAIKKVKISGVSNIVSLHYKKDNRGNFILNAEGQKEEVNFVSTGNNHHVAIYRDEKGDLQEEVVSFFEAVERKNQGRAVVEKQHEKGWEFLFTLKQNEYFVFPSMDFDPGDIDLMDPTNYSLISPNLYRVQKIAAKNYMFRHHLETNVEEPAALKGIAFKSIRSTAPLKGIVKVRLNHLGKIVQIGESSPNILLETIAKIKKNEALPEK